MWDSANKTYLLIHGREIDLAASRIKGANAWVQIKPKSMAVLEYLLSRPQHVCAREEILTAVWGKTIVSDDVLSQAVKELRKAFDDDFKSPEVIETILRRGYRLLVEPTSSRDSTRIWPRLAMFTIAAIVIFAVYLYTMRPQELEMQTVVVLPFVQPQGELASVTDGIVDEITARLVGLPNLHVVARTSAFTFRSSTLDIPAIAEKLDADLLIEGSVYREGEQYRIHVQLLDRDGLHRWAETFTETDNGLLHLFSRVASNVTSHFGEKEAAQQGVKSIPDDVFVNYLQAEYLLRRNQGGWTTKIIPMYESVLREAPDYADAWAGLADVEYRKGTSPILRFENPEDAKLWLKRSRQSADQALHLDPDHSRALTVKARLAVIDYLWVEADEFYRQAMEMHPGDADLLARYAEFLYKVGYVTQAFKVAKRAFRLDPYSPFSSRLVAIGFFAAEDFDTAMEYTKLTGQLKGKPAIAVVPVLQTSLSLKRGEDAGQCQWIVGKMAFILPISPDFLAMVHWPSAQLAFVRCNKNLLSIS